MRTVWWMRCTVYLSLRPSSHEIWASPGNTAKFFGPLVTILTGFHCILKCSIDPISAPFVKKHSNTPSPGRAGSVKYRTPGPTKTIRSPPHALPLPLAGITLIGALVALIKMPLITVRKVGFRKLYKGVLRMKPQASRLSFQSAFHTLLKKS